MAKEKDSVERRGIVEKVMQKIMKKDKSVLDRLAKY